MGLASPPPATRKRVPRPAEPPPHKKEEAEMKEHKAQRWSRRYRLNKVVVAALVACIVLVSAVLHNRTTGSSILPVHAAMTLPFVLLLLSIAVVPFISARLWERNYAYVSFGLALISVAYYTLILGNGGRMIQTAGEYYSFMALIGSLFIVSGGIYIRIKGESTPLRNTLLLAIGAVASNFLGTTGASMALIRPYLRTNRHRVSGYHVVFFIFVVSNIGGMLTPIGDPPLFLGYLKGVPFFWVIVRIWPIWVMATGLVLATFYFIDRYHFKKLPAAMERHIEAKEEHARIGGVGNIGLLAVILGAVFFPPPAREIVMLLAALASCLTTHSDVHEKNEFCFTPVKEVAILFAGIFATMTPVMDWVELNAGSLTSLIRGNFTGPPGRCRAFWTTPRRT